jgi:hypothetical protein
MNQLSHKDVDEAYEKGLRDGVNGCATAFTKLCLGIFFVLTALAASYVLIRWFR